MSKTTFERIIVFPCPSCREVYHDEWSASTCCAALSEERFKCTCGELWVNEASALRCFYSHCEDEEHD